MLLLFVCSIYVHAVLSPCQGYCIILLLSLVFSFLRWVYLCVHALFCILIFPSMCSVTVHFTLWCVLSTSVCMFIRLVIGSFFLNYVLNLLMHVFCFAFVCRIHLAFYAFECAFCFLICVLVLEISSYTMGWIHMCVHCFLLLCI